MLLEGRPGQVVIADGSLGVAGFNRLGGLLIQPVHGPYAEAAKRGRIMEACTPVAGVAPGTALSTTPPMALWNPPSSGVELYVKKSYLGFISGTLGAGTVVYAVVTSQTTVPTGGTELTPQCSKIGMPRGAGRAFQGSTLASTPAILRPGYVVGAFTTSTATAPDPSLDLIDDAIIVTPGSVLCMQEIGAAGTSPLCLFGLVWEEVPV
jgi:hypothetical protein